MSADSPAYTVLAIRTGTMTVDRAALLYGARPGTLVDIPVWAALVEGNGGGSWSTPDSPSRPDGSSTHPHSRNRANRWGRRWPSSAGSFGHIDTVVNSHLHYDHRENNPALTQAQFFVSAREWEFALWPVPSEVCRRIAS